MDFKDMAARIIEGVGGEGNVEYVTHCVTRLRFVLKDDKRVNQQLINDIDGVLGSTFGAGQFQIVLGKNLQPAFEAVTKGYTFDVGEVVDENLDQDLEKGKPTVKGILMGLVNFLAACVTPMIPGLTVVGLIKVCLVLVTLVDAGLAETQTYLLVNNIVNTCFYFMPVLVSYGTAKRMGCTPIYAMIVACLLLHPDTISMLSGEGGLHVFGLYCYPASYASSFLPAILSTVAVAYIEKFLDTHIPGSFKGIFVGGITLVVASTLTLVVLGPIGFFLGNYFIQLLVWLQSTVGPFALAFLGGILPWVIMSGMHTVFGPVMTQSIATLGYEGFLRPTQFIHNVSEGGACFGVALRTKNPELRSEAISSGTGAILAGVSEPAIYGINLRLKKPMFGVMTGGAIGGFIAGLFHVKAYAYGSPSAMALPIYGDTIIGVLIAIAVAFVVSFAVAYFSGFDDVPVK